MGRGAGGTLLTKTIFPVSECGVEKPELPHRNGRGLYVNNRRHIVYKHFSKNKKQGGDNFYVLLTVHFSNI